jgi:hypothetical protein
MHAQQNSSDALYPSAASASQGDDHRQIEKITSIQRLDSCLDTYLIKLQNGATYVAYSGGLYEQADGQLYKHFRATKDYTKNGLDLLIPNIVDAEKKTAQVGNWCQLVNKAAQAKKNYELVIC